MSAAPVGRGHAPPRAQIETPDPAPAPRPGFTLLPGPELGRLQRTTIRSALALGVGAFSNGIYHVVTHAFFKACLFMGAGSVISGCHHEQDMRHFGGLR